MHLCISLNRKVDRQEYVEIERRIDTHTHTHRPPICSISLENPNTINNAKICYTKGLDADVNFYNNLFPW